MNQNHAANLKVNQNYDYLKDKSAEFVYREKGTEQYIANLFKDLEQSLDAPEESSDIDYTQRLLNSLQMKILKPDTIKNNDSKRRFKASTSILIKLESLLSKLQILISNRTKSKNAKHSNVLKQLNVGVSIISGIMHASNTLEDLSFFCPVLPKRMESIRIALLDEGIDLTTDENIEHAVLEEIKGSLNNSVESDQVVKLSPLKRNASPISAELGKFYRFISRNTFDQRCPR